MRSINPALEHKFVSVVTFLNLNQDLAQAPRNTTLFSDAYLYKHAQTFSVSRNPSAPSVPGTVSDPMIRSVLEGFWDITANESARAIELHNYAMGAENIIGNLLERYIAAVLEPTGWVWCSGSVAKAVDFIYQDNNGTWRALQVKNRDNSENSSSKAIRNGTNIAHWFRTFSKRPGDNWAAFPVAGDVHP